MEIIFQGKKRNMFVIKIGGSILFDEQGQLNQKLISQYANTIKDVFSGTKNKCAIIVGGGKIARKYIAVARALGASEAYNDVLGIEAAKLNARLLISSLGDIAYPDPPASFQEYQALSNLTDKIIVCGGFQPGQSTNAVAASVAELTHAEKFINLTDVDGVYSADPDKDPSAKLLSEMTIDDFMLLIASQNTRAGQYPLFDYTAVQIVKRSAINLQFVNGNNPDNIRKAIENKKIGTLITHKKKL
ncbi:MAG: UMP kinase [Candidatus Thorarchaeota archaeon]